MDYLHSSYMDALMKEKAPQVHQFLKENMCTNTTDLPYQAKAHDERHEVIYLFI